MLFYIAFVDFQASDGCDKPIRQRFEVALTFQVFMPLLYLFLVFKGDICSKQWPRYVLYLIILGIRCLQLALMATVPDEEGCEDAKDVSIDKSTYFLVAAIVESAVIVGKYHFEPMGVIIDNYGLQMNIDGLTSYIQKQRQRDVEEQKKLKELLEKLDKLEADIKSVGEVGEGDVKVDLEEGPRTEANLLNF